MAMADYAAIPIPGSATYANEGVIAQLVPPGGKLLIHTNGVYGDRLIEIASQLGTPYRGDPHGSLHAGDNRSVRPGNRR